ncbi:hypothetical protein MNEG_11678, partial [Monoraphidium neglectum]
MDIIVLKVLGLYPDDKHSVSLGEPAGAKRTHAHCSDNSGGALPPKRHRSDPAPAPQPPRASARPAIPCIQDSPVAPAGGALSLKGGVRKGGGGSGRGSGRGGEQGRGRGGGAAEDWVGGKQ